MCRLCTRHQYKTNIDPSVSSSLGKRVLICVKYRKIITIKLSCVGFIFTHGSLGAHEEKKKRKKENLTQKGGKITPEPNLL